VTYPDLFHIGFFQESRDKVEAIHRHLKEGGFAPDEPHEEHGS